MSFRIFLTRKLALHWLKHSHMLFDDFIKMALESGEYTPEEIAYIHKKLKVLTKNRFETSLVREARSCYKDVDEFMNEITNS